MQPAAQRLRFLLDFGYAKVLLASELIGTTLGRADHWLRLTGKGYKEARVALQRLAWDAVTRYLAARDLSVTA